ncbi:hypothetical protein ACTFIU_004371 [Dictyostelium citrinum]
MVKPNNVKIKNKGNLKKSNESQNDYMKSKKLETKSYQKALLSKNSGDANQAKRLKKKEEFKKKLEKRQNTIVIKDKLKEPSTFLKEDQSFFDQNIFNDQDDYKQQQMNRININENFETNLFSDMINEFDGDLNDDLDLLDYNDDAIDGDSNFDNDQFNSEDEEFYEKQSKKNKKGNDDEDNDDNNNKKSKKSNKKDDNENESSEKFESFPMDENNEQEEESSSKKKKKTGGFQSMDLNKNLLKAILKKGFNVPTPIQRKSIPMILDGHDVVGMARTGSGKTGAFVIPMIQKLGDHSTTVGVRAIILSPTRELAIQTFKVVKDFSQGTQLRTILIVGGDSMEDQFTDLARNPDIIIATPGRLMHHLLETGMSLSKVQYIVFDEADRLFEMGFNEQLTEILSKLSENRQTLLFSATLPSLLVDFVRAGLNNPKLINLDTDTKISENLSLSFFTLRQEEKLGVLLFLLKDIIYKKSELPLLNNNNSLTSTSNNNNNNNNKNNNEPNQQQRKPSTIIFVSTKYHVEFIHILLERAGIASTYIHGYLDPVARKINLAKFRSNQVGIMVVTDLAARGIDIPLLDNVINFDFPPKEKIFIHRVGRVARAGRSGIAYSLVSPDEVPYMIDLHLYLGRKFLNKFEHEGQTINDPKYSFYGTIPQTIIDRETEFVNVQRKECIELLSLTKTIYNAHKKYLSTRPGASHESNKRAKAMDKSRYHPMLNDQLNSNDQIRNDFIQSLKSFRPPQTVLELDARKNNVQVSIMKDKRKVHTNVIESQQKKLYLQQSETNLGPENEEFDYSKLDSRKRLSQLTENITEEMLRSNKSNNDDSDDKNNKDIKMKDENDDEDEQEEEDDEEDNEEDDGDEENDESNNKFNIKIESSNKDDNKKKSKSRSSSRDPNFFISATPENLIQERAMSISNRFTKDDEVNLVADTDRKQKKSMVWDKRKGKFVSSQADADRKNSKKLVRNEAGKLVEAKKSHKGYEEWKKKTHGRIQRVGEDENAKYQPNQKEYLPQKWRGQNREKEKKENKASHAKGSHGLKGRPNELKDKHQISKNRSEKERKMRVNKTKGNPKGKSKTGGGKGSKFGSGKSKGGKRK